MELQCALQKYDWGKMGGESEVALLLKAKDERFTIEENVPYAELWMGTHPNGPSHLSSSGESLHEWLLVYPQALGEGAIDKFGVQLPFLFKVLSVQKALSIQVHPSKVCLKKFDTPFIF